MVNSCVLEFKSLKICLALAVILDLHLSFSFFAFSKIMYVSRFRKIEWINFRHDMNAKIIKINCQCHIKHTQTSISVMSIQISQNHKTFCHSVCNGYFSSTTVKISRVVGNDLNNRLTQWVEHWFWRRIIFNALQFARVLF